jgi:hypothetical protein
MAQPKDDTTGIIAILATIRHQDKFISLMPSISVSSNAIEIMIEWLLGVKLLFETNFTVETVFVN